VFSARMVKALTRLACGATMSSVFAAATHGPTVYKSLGEGFCTAADGKVVTYTGTWRNHLGSCESFCNEADECTAYAEDTPYGESYNTKCFFYEPGRYSPPDDVDPMGSDFWFAEGSHDDVDGATGQERNGTDPRENPHNSVCMKKVIAECGSDKYERRFAQCAGYGYKGETCCPAGWSCTAQNKYYSQCESIAPQDFLDTVTADVLLQEPPQDMATPTDLEVEAQGDACLAQVNKYRATKNLAALRMNSGKNSCAGGQAAKDGPGLTPHAHAGECGESGQCESAGQSSCVASIQGYFGEGPGGGHYKIIMDPSYRSMAYGHKDIGGKYRTWWTQDFFTSSSEDTIVEAAVESNSTVDGKGTCCKCSSSADCSGSMTCCPRMHKCIKSESTACFTDRDCHPANTVASITV